MGELIWSDLASGILHESTRIVAQATQVGGPEWTLSRVVGRLHPVFIHFPIAFVIAAAFLELRQLVRREPEMPSGSVPLIVVAAIAAVVVAGTGWLNAAWEYEHDRSDGLFWHRWLGISAAALLVALAWIAVRSKRADVLASLHTARRLGALVAALGVIVVAHFGGEIVRGEGFILAGLHSSRVGDSEASASDAVIVDDAPSAPPTPQEAFFLASVRPTFEARCSECHGPKKQKGGLRLMPIGAAFALRVEDWPIIPARADKSELMRRIQLPADDPDAMPPPMPSKDARLTSAEIAAIRQWIAEGAVVPASERASTQGTKP